MDRLGRSDGGEGVSQLGLGVQSLQRLLLGLTSTHGVLVVVILVSAGKDLLLAGGCL